MKRYQQILAAVLVFQVALTAFVFWPKATSTSEGQPLFLEVEAQDIIGLTITDDQGATVTLHQVDNAWVLPEADDYPANTDAVSQVLDKILALETSRLVTRTAASHKQLQVSADDFVRKVVLEKGNGTSYTVYIGSAPQYAATHFRVEGQDEAYLTENLSSWDLNATASSWVDSSYLNLAPEELTEVVVENANGVFTFVRNKEDAWVLKELPSHETLASSVVTSLVSRVASLSLMRPLGKEADPAYALDDPAAVVTLKTADETVTLTVGAKQDTNYVVKASNSPYYVAAAEYNVSSLVENKLADFVEAEPTPELMPTTTP